MSNSAAIILWRMEMENQHRKISGYRELSQEDINLMNAIKEAERTLIELTNQVSAGIGINGRSAAIAKTHLETGMMWLVRAVARPNGE